MRDVERSPALDLMPPADGEKEDDD
jgi:hypothetical protein